MKIKLSLILGTCVLVLIGLGFVFRDQFIALVFRPTGSLLPSGVTEVSSWQIEVMASNLDTPWGIAKLPSGELLITERSGQLTRIGQNGATIAIEGVEETSEGGLLGLALHPQFEDNQLLYLYFTTTTNGQLTNQVVRYKLTSNRLTGATTVLTNIPASQNHDGGFLAFGPDKKLYITTGDSGQAELAQDTSSLAGKILRLNPDGSIPSDNPFGNAVWSYGHRNPQGLAWDDTGRLWATEHGPSGVDSGRDELNLIRKGANYGWPEITGNETRQGMVGPVAQSGDNDTWAPSGIVYENGSLFFTGLRGQSLYQARMISDTKVELVQHLQGQYGRLRAILRDGEEIIVGTSNRDGRGSPTAGDDRLLRLNLALFE